MAHLLRENEWLRSGGLTNEGGKSIDLIAALLHPEYLGSPAHLFLDGKLFGVVKTTANRTELEPVGVPSIKVIL